MTNASWTSLVGSPLCLFRMVVFKRRGCTGIDRNAVPDAQTATVMHSKDVQPVSPTTSRYPVGGPTQVKQDAA
ncbi:unnamed protein product [Ixodes pacificus]